MLPTRLLVVHDAKRRGEDQVSELTGREQVCDPLLNILDGDVETRANHTALVDAAVELNNNLAGTVVVDNLELVNVPCRERNQSTTGNGPSTHRPLVHTSAEATTRLTMLLHHRQKLDNHLRLRADEYLALATLLSVGNALKAVGEHSHADHGN